MKLLFKATIRAAISHCAPIWAIGDTGQGLSKTKLRPLEKLQNRCLRLVAGAYKRTPTAALEKELEIPPLPLYLQSLALTHVENTRNRSPEKEIQERCAKIRHRLLTGRARSAQIKPTPQEGLRRLYLKERARITEVEPNNRATQERENNTRALRQAQEYTRTITAAQSFLQRIWNSHFQRQKRGKKAAIWHQNPKETGEKQREGLKAAEAAIATQFRSEKTGLRAYLAAWGVPGFEPSCKCGHPKETVHHVVLRCPLRREGRYEMWQAARTQNGSRILKEKRGIQAVARWAFQQGILPQFSLAREQANAREKPSEWHPFPFLDEEDSEEEEEES